MFVIIIITVVILIYYIVHYQYLTLCDYSNQMVST